MAVLIAGRWYHEQRIAASVRTGRHRPGQRGKLGPGGGASLGPGNRLRLPGQLSQPLYWLGLTTSAALAAQAIAALIAWPSG
jgi:hypothetical protein